MRIFKRGFTALVVAVFLAILAFPGCAFSTRTVGMEDPSVEIVRALSATQASTIKALTDALTAAQKSACEVIR